jgi:hypothetical protein
MVLRCCSDHLVSNQVFRRKRVGPFRTEEASGALSEHDQRTPGFRLLTQEALNPSLAVAATNSLRVNLFTSSCTSNRQGSRIRVRGVANRMP